MVVALDHGDRGIGEIVNAFLPAGIATYDQRVWPDKRRRRLTPLDGGPYTVTGTVGFPVLLLSLRRQGQNVQQRRRS